MVAARFARCHFVVIRSQLNLGVRPQRIKCPMNEKQQILRHFLAVLAYRTRKALKGAPDDFGVFQAGGDVRTPQELLDHMNNLLIYTLAAFRGEPSDEMEVTSNIQLAEQNFYSLLEELSQVLAKLPLEQEGLPERLLQGPLADAMTHTGQLALLRRLAGAPLAAEDFFRADIDPDSFNHR